MDTRYGTFLDSYNKGNVFFDRIISSFFEKISYDIKTIINGNNEVLKNKFKQIDNLINEPNRNSYDKIMSFADMVDDTSLISDQNSNGDINTYRKNIANIIFGLLDVAKSTEDSYLIDKSLKIANQFNPAV